MRLIGALDQGTSSTRFILFDESGSIIGQSQKRT
jgi:glycerol kinase